MKKTRTVAYMQITLLCLVLSFDGPSSRAANPSAKNPIVLENNTLRAEFDRHYGTLLTLLYKETGRVIERRTELAQSFRLLVPTKQRRDNTVVGKNHALKSHRFTDSGTRLQLEWEGLHGDVTPGLDITFRGFIELTKAGLIFSAQIENRSNLSVDGAYWPYLGDLAVPDRRESTNWLNFEYGGGMRSIPITPHFQSYAGYFGVDYPIQMHKTQYAHFGLLQSGDQGIYVGYHDTTDRHLVNFTFELIPGFEYAHSMNYGTVPEQDTISGKPVRIEFSCVHFPYVNSGESASLQPIVFNPYTGDWHAGSDFYTAWRKSWEREKTVPEWAREVHSWQQIHINSSEDRPVFQYSELVDYCTACRQNDVRAIQLTGWTIGGQDRGNPSHDIDSRLGSYEDLRNAISTCEEMGVRIILFNKYTWADRSQSWFDDELVRYGTKDPYGDCHYHNGYAYQTATQLSNINTRRFVPMCPLSEAWRKIAVREFKKSIALGASGMLYDENQHHGGHVYCFDPKHGHHVPANIFSGDWYLEQDFREVTAKLKPDYLFAGESNRDLQFRHYDLSYFRIDKDYVPMHRYVAPNDLMAIAVIGHNDRHTINQALMYNFILSYEPRNFKGKLSEFPLTLEYGKMVDRLRSKYAGYLWHGLFQDTMGATVRTQSDYYPHYSVFVHRENGKKAVVIVNPGREKIEALSVNIHQNSGKLFVAHPEEPEKEAYHGSIELEPLSAAVVFEE